MHTRTHSNTYSKHTHTHSLARTRAHKHKDTRTHAHYGENNNNNAYLLEWFNNLLFPHLQKACFVFWDINGAFVDLFKSWYNQHLQRDNTTIRIALAVCEFANVLVISLLIYFRFRNPFLSVLYISYLIFNTIYINIYIYIYIYIYIQLYT